ncbi:WhiB family transcriptional regulator [Mycobacterium sp. 29Ha]|uniref:WhiB family transcriptional regulator n=1 Tax=Mycobacterium sp. 29Ha TaxID=2939268 RepID=UPI0029390C4D|nr:WhiB family transcriptional regulator [Mycobacterium sp. 29Ha]MDV3133277.1 WhiB family transcriptional regulator [Mycobacterium sp. 29Ha]
MAAVRVGPTRLVCQADPERWFDRHNRTYALERCLACPGRSWCAEQALDGASYGMWAGIWIDNNLDAVSHYLRAIAQGPADSVSGDRDPASAAPPTSTPTSPPPVAETPAETPAPHGVSRTVVAVILARSSGHCEAMTPVCRYTQDTIASRVPGHSGWHAEDASSAYGVCRPCQRALSSTEDRLLRRLGYIVDPPGNPTFTPLYWRQARWVYLDSGPTIVEVDRRITRADQAV